MATGQGLSHQSSLHPSLRASSYSTIMVAAFSYWTRARRLKAHPIDLWPVTTFGLNALTGDMADAKINSAFSARAVIMVD
jgi:hypothetical protein